MVSERRRKSVSSSTSSGEIFETITLKGQLNNFNFDVITFARETSQRPLHALMGAIFTFQNYFETFKICRAKFKRFCKRVESSYNKDLPYHNAEHAADVVNSTSVLLFSMGLGKNLTPVQSMAAIIAAAVHDMHHPGRSNKFLIQTHHPLAILYNDRAVLEQMHVAEAFKVLRTPHHDILSNLSNEMYVEFRKLVIHAVLATDLKEHFDTITRIRSLKPDSPLIAQENSVLIVEVAIKVADVGHSAKSWDLHLQWSKRIEEEFYLQGDEEKALGMEISPFHDRKDGRIASNQQGFFKFICMPLFESFTTAFPEFRPCLKQAKKNLTRWHKIETGELALE